MTMSHIQSRLISTLDLLGKIQEYAKENDSGILPVGYFVLPAFRVKFGKKGMLCFYDEDI